MKRDKLISVRVDSKQLRKLSNSLGIDESKTIRACMNCTENVLQRFFGGEVSDIFKRKKTDEELNRYENIP